MNEISNRFKVFASKECHGSSQLYEHLSINIANDNELLQLATHTKQGQPIPNLFFGAIHYLLLQGKNHELRQYYSSIVKKPKDSSIIFPVFKDFCILYQDEIIFILKSKLVQTNEVRRCAYLYPSFCHIYQMVKKPLALIEIGTSAGLQLLWDKYCYSYQSNERYGDIHSNLIISSEIRGDIPFLYKKSPPITKRIGIDLHVNDVTDPDDYLWLKSLIWADHTERISNFENAVRCVKEQSLELIEGDGVKLLTEIASEISQDSVVCIFHTHVANQIPKEDKYELIARIKKLGEVRDVFHLYNNMWDLNKLHLEYYLDGKQYKETIAETDGHGRWFKWKHR
jgi:hypothetical protein